MMRIAIAVLLLGVALLHLAPLVGVLGPGRLKALYGITVDEPNLEILMRHRAVLFGLLGAFLAAAAFVPAWQPAALAAGVVSVGSFLVLASSIGGVSDAVRRVVVADWMALAALAVAAVLWSVARPTPS